VAILHIDELANFSPSPSGNVGWINTAIALLFTPWNEEGTIRRTITGRTKGVRDLQDHKAMRKPNTDISFYHAFFSVRRDRSMISYIHRINQGPAPGAARQHWRLTMNDLIDAMTTFINDAVDDRIDAQLEMRLQSIIEEALSSVEGFDMEDHESEITALIDEVLSEKTFSVTID